MHAVDGGMNGSTVLFVCRANQGGTDYDVGHLDWTGCHTMTGRVMAVRKDNYQVITLTTQISIILRQLIFGPLFFHYGLIPHVMLNFCIHKFINFAPFLMLLQLISGNLSPYYAYYQPYAYSSG